MPLISGTAILSLTGIGRHSTMIPTTDPINAFIGFIKKAAPRKAKIKPKIVPSKCLALLNGNCIFPNFLPNNAAVPSPNVRIVIEA